jgi:hypothetical protein
MSVIGGKQNDCLTKGDVMSANDTFLAIFLGSKTSARMTAWNALSEEAREPAGDAVLFGNFLQL